VKLPSYDEIMQDNEEDQEYVQEELKKALKEAEELNKDLTAKMDIDGMNVKYNKQTDTIENISFNSFSLPGIGIEPNVNAVVTNTEMNKISKPIKGNNGVFVIKVINIIPAAEKTDYSQDKLALMRNQASQVYKLFDAIEKKAEITDNRARWF
jgi:peptidyl-prolyl cis-trans isomerase D